MSSAPLPPPPSPVRPARVPLGEVSSAAACRTLAAVVAAMPLDAAPCCREAFAVR